MGKDKLILKKPNSKVNPMEIHRKKMREKEKLKVLRISAKNIFLHFREKSIINKNFKIHKINLIRTPNPF